MRVEKDQTLILWPSLKTYNLEKGEICKNVFNDNDFTVHVEFSVDKKENYTNEPIAIFWKVPFIFSIGINPHTYQDSDGQTIHSNLFFTNCSFNTNDKEDITRKGLNFNFEFNKNYEFTVNYSVKDKKIKYYIDYEFIFDIEVGDNIFSQHENPQILLGNDKFDNEPTYCIDFKYLILSKNNLTDSEIKLIKTDYVNNLNQYNEYVNSERYGLLGLYDFKELTKFKIFDFTGNNNHIYIQTIKNG